MYYLTAIKTAFLCFPFIAFLFTIPFILQQYHRYGSIHKLRVLIIYSFILYLMCAYFLVVLPLSPKEGFVPLNKNMVQLIPFGFITDILKETSFRLQNPSTYLKALTDPCVYTVLFNIGMTIPFGIYLRYYFKCTKKKTILYTFYLSLFFELTQLTRVYFIFPYPYRVFDVDDLIINTLGGFIGYILVPVFQKLLPTRDEIDEKSYKRGRVVSPLRRITLFYLDFVFCAFLGFLAMLLKGKIYFFFLFFFIYYILMPIFMENQTLGGKFLNVQIKYKNYPTFWGFLRIIFLYTYYFGIPVSLLKSTIFLVNYLNIEVRTRIFCYLGVFAFCLFFLLGHAIILFKNHFLYYDNLFKVEYISTTEEKENGKRKEK